MTISYKEENNKDCSLGLCTIYCPQHCYPLFPPSPPFPLAADFHTLNLPSLSPLLVTIIAFLATFSLLITYRKLISNFYHSFYSRRHLAHPNNNSSQEEEDEESRSEDFLEESSWHLPHSIGLDEELIRKITTFKYKRGDGRAEAAECAVCLAEFIENESLRLLPKCSHAFHLRCIDTWLTSHSNCPLCRLDVLMPRMAEEEDRNDVVVIEVKDARRDEVAPVGSSRRGGRGKVRSARSRSLHAVMRPVRMKRSVFGGRSWFARRARGRALLLPVL